MRRIARDYSAPRDSLPLRLAVVLLHPGEAGGEAREGVAVPAVAARVGDELDRGALLLQPLLRLLRVLELAAHVVGRVVEEVGRALAVLEFGLELAAHVEDRHRDVGR